jgi:hypothetical protein
VKAPITSKCKALVRASIDLELIRLVEGRGSTVAGCVACWAGTPPARSKLTRNSDLPIELSRRGAIGHRRFMLERGHSVRCSEFGCDRAPSAPDVWIREEPRPRLKRVKDACLESIEIQKIYLNTNSYIDICAQVCTFQ